MKPLRLLLPLLAAMATAGQPAGAADFAAAGAAIQSRTLGNGMQIIVWPDRNIPSVTLYNWVRVGSRNEGTGTSGLAHFFEHMMFNGTSKRGRGEFDALMQASGGSNNASTSQDVTIYTDWFPASALEMVFDLESDRLANLALVPEVVESERGVVYSERRLRVEDSNPAFLDEQVGATAFLAHPYRIPTIGWPSDIQSWTLQDLQSFFRTWYVPNNCTVVIVGDVQPAAVFALAEKYFAPLPRGPEAAPVRTREPEQLGERRVMVRRPGQNPLLQVAYPAISAVDPRAPALNLLQTVLLGGDSSRLHRSLVEQQELAIGIGGGWSEGFDPSVFSFHATLPAGGDTTALEKALADELQKVLTDGVSEPELQRAKNQIAASFWRGLATIDGKAHMLGEYAVFHGDYRKLFDAPAAYERVTREQVLAVAREIFQPMRRTTGVLLPQRAGRGTAR